MKKVRAKEKIKKKYPTKKSK